MTALPRTSAHALAEGVAVVTSCRVCGEADLQPILDLGEQAVGNAFHAPGAPAPLVAPLQITRCGSCSLVQLAHTVDPELMYTSYWYRSGINHTMRSHLAQLAQQAADIADLQPGEAVLDIGCNDGTTLKAYPAHAHRVGVDPSNIAPESCDAYVNDYFSAEAVRDHLPGGEAKLITSIAMFYDLNDPRSFVADIAQCLAEDGVWVAELSYLPAMLRALAYDAICHEHVCYYRIMTFEQVLEGSGLELFDVEFNDCNGGSFRLFVAPRGSCEVTDRLRWAKAEESRQLLDTEIPYATFRKQVADCREQLQAFLHEAQASGKIVYGYGASTKGMVTLQSCDVTPSLMPAIAERNPEKYGLLTPGTDIPICSEREMRDANPDYLVVLPWHFIDEFLDREQEYLRAGGKLVVPMPEFRVHELCEERS